MVCFSIIITYFLLFSSITSLVVYIFWVVLCSDVCTSSLSECWNAASNIPWLCNRYDVHMHNCDEVIRISLAGLLGNMAASWIFLDIFLSHLLVTASYWGCRGAVCPCDLHSALMNVMWAIQCQYVHSKMHQLVCHTLCLLTMRLCNIFVNSKARLSTICTLYTRLSVFPSCFVRRYDMSKKTNKIVQSDFRSDLLVSSENVTWDCRMHYEDAYVNFRYR